MSGIYGYISNTKEKLSLETEIARTRLWNKAYGQDGQAEIGGEGFLLGCFLEKVSKTAPISAPVLQSDSCYGVIDALLYNRKELIEDFHLKGDLSDEEIVFTLVLSQGSSILSRINGDFAGVLYDQASGQITLFRDHLGVRPLYYYACDSFFLFSTDFRGILAVNEVDVSPDPQWIYANFYGQSFQDPARTEYQKIYRVAPATFLTFQYNKSQQDASPEIKSQLYWKIGSRKIRLSSFEDYKKRLYELTEDAIRIRANATSEPIGAELSGGMDSGVIDILLHRMGKDCIYHSWSVDPKELDYVKQDERLVIQDVCQQEHISCHYSPSSVLIPDGSHMDRMTQAIGLRRTPEDGLYTSYALLPHMNTTPLCNTAEYMADQGCKLIFSGHGGDEGVSHRSRAYELYYNKEYLHYFRILWSRSHGKKGRLAKTYQEWKKDQVENSPLLREPYSSPLAAPELLKNSFAQGVDDSFAALYSFAFDAKTYVSGSNTQNRLLNVALYGAYNGVRYVFPYLDYRLIDFAVSIPRHLFVNWKWNRLIFRETFKDLMPKSMYRLRTKEDFSRNALEAAQDPSSQPDWFQEFRENSQKTLRLLDPQLWNPYLDLEKLSQFRQGPRPSDEEEFHYDCILYTINNCLYAQVAVEKARSLPI